MATVLNLTLDQGTDFDRTLSFLADTTPIDLTGYTFRGQARDGYAAKVAAFSFSFVLANQGTDPGKVAVTIPAAATQDLKLTVAKDYVYDIERVEPGGKVRRVLEGTITVRPEATK